MSDRPAIVVSNVRKNFKLPHERTSSIKSALVNFYKRKKTFETQEVLKGVSFEIQPGDFFAIVGRNGSGKSTLLKLLAGIYTPSKGNIVVNGKLTPFIELGVGFNPELSGRENVYLNGALLGFSRREMDAMYSDIVSFAELHRFMDQKLKNYSSGMQVRLAFSIAIRARTDILLLDEVLAVGDAAFQQKCFDYFEQLKRDKKTVVFVTHDMGAVRRFCNKAIYVKNGKLTHQGTPAEIADVYLEENMEKPTVPDAKQDDTPKINTRHTVHPKITSQTSESLKLEVAYKTTTDEAMYLGIAIIKEGISVAEINSLPTIKFTSDTTITYTLNTRLFNGGIYELGVGLFKVANREEINAGKNRLQFIIKGSDPTKGAALKLENTWQQQTPLS